MQSDRNKELEKSVAPKKQEEEEISFRPLGGFSTWVLGLVGERVFSFSLVFLFGSFQFLCFSGLCFFVFFDTGFFFSPFSYSVGTGEDQSSIFFLEGKWKIMC